jgi:hypothetical protein
VEALERLAAVGWEVRQRNFLPHIHFYYPHNTLAVSVTGTHCELNCAHCGGHYLKNMRSLDDAAATPSSASSCLISGGCTVDGKVPFIEHLEKLQHMKHGRKYNMHVGLLDDTEIDALTEVADCVSFDFIGADATITEVLGLSRTVEDYADCYRKLRSRVKVIPHVCIGLHGGSIRGEYRALEMLAELGAETITFIVFMPTRGSRFADCAPPLLDETVAILSHARSLFPKLPIHLGCMRPGGRYRNELDQWAVKTGINGIVNPTPAAAALAQQMGLFVQRGEECCSL